jgi:hypothetical protein
MSLDIFLFVWFWFLNASGMCDVKLDLLCLMYLASSFLLLLYLYSFSFLLLRLFPVFPSCLCFYLFIYLIFSIVFFLTYISCIGEFHCDIYIYAYNIFWLDLPLHHSLIPHCPFNNFIRFHCSIFILITHSFYISFMFFFYFFELYQLVSFSLIFIFSCLVVCSLYFVLEVLGWIPRPALCMLGGCFYTELSS